MSTNMDLWERVCKTDPRAVKKIEGKPYQGNSPKPYWLIEQATKTFGPVGVGWGVIVKSERFEKLGEFDVLHVAVVSVWYVLDGIRTESFDQMGGTKAAYKTKSGALVVDEDAGKKSVTDGMVKCLSMIGFAGDIFSGRWDDSKYVASLREEFGNESPLEQTLQASVEAAKQKKQGVMGAVLADIKLDAATEIALSKLAKEVTALAPDLGFDRIEMQELNSDEKTVLWSHLPSNVRSALKREGEARKVTS